eukprot:14518553-Alexandrium_andersonii.AAC.1
MVRGQTAGLPSTRLLLGWGLISWPGGRSSAGALARPSGWPRADMRQSSGSAGSRMGDGGGPQTRA